MSRNPFFDAADALAAHAKQQQGRVIKLLTDDPETAEEIAKEKERQRSLRYLARKRESYAVRGPDGRFIKE